MEIGVYVNQYGSPDAGFGYEAAREQVERIEDLGYDSVAVGERHFYGDGVLDPWTCLDAFGAWTDAIEIVSNILILPVYHPIHVAERIANLDRLTGGRTTFGFAIGYRPLELENFGVDLDERGARFAESIECVKRLLSGERFDHDGDHFSFEDAFVRPTPVQSPRPPLLAGGGGPVARKRAAYRCDGFSAAGAPPDELEETIDAYRDVVREAGRDPEEMTVATNLMGFVAGSASEARAALEPHLLSMLERYAEWGNPQTEPPDWEDVEDEVVAGPPADAVERLERLEAIGVDHVFYRPQYPGMDPDTAMETIERFGDEVLPAF